MDTREWTDGVLTASARQVVKEPIEVQSWIVCDGDIDPEWVESLNSVLDDNRFVMLPTVLGIGVLCVVYTVHVHVHPVVCSLDVCMYVHWVLLGACGVCVYMYIYVRVIIFLALISFHPFDLLCCTYTHIAALSYIPHCHLSPVCTSTHYPCPLLFRTPHS